MKKFLLTITTIFMCITAHAKTETINWYMDGNTYATTQCETGSDIILPQTPYKYGYTFNGWFGYTPIEYLESTGTQYIDTGVYGTGDTTIEVSASKINNNTAQAIFGARTSPTSNRLDLLFAENSRQAWFGYNTAAQEFTPSTDKKTYLSDKGKSYINGSLVGSLSHATFTTPTTLKLFCNETDGVRSQFSHGRIYYVKIYDNDVLVRDFIPVLDSNNVPCMYDKVEHTFYYNQGTGQFIAGPLIGE